jgi:putative transposase
VGDYRRVFVPGGTYFFTVVTADRRPIFAHEDSRAVLAQVMRHVWRDRPFRTLALVVLPDHLHAVWQLPDGAADFPSRWRRIKQRTTLGLRPLGVTGPVWQPRYWERLMRDPDHLARYLDYIHYNPVKHGYVQTPGQWPASTFHRFVCQGIYCADWAGPADSADLPE